VSHLKQLKNTLAARHVDDIDDHRLSPTVMSDRDFSRLSEFIQNACGIRMPAAKKLMLEGRLRKRLRTLGMESFQEYCDYLFAPGGMQAEQVHMIDAVTTNKTDFFREPAHFDYLLQEVLPEMVNVHGLGVRTRLNLWSAGCSTGEEPYTLAMVVSEFAGRYSRFGFSVLATDISTRVLEKSRRGIYEDDRVEPIPMAMRRKYLLKGKDKKKGLVRIAPELRSLVKFQRLNFMHDDFGIGDPMAVIFCRNVLIYFDKPTQERLLNRLCRYLIPGGYLFTGHSETLHGMSLPLEQTATTVYRRQA
jgi:chemotaxis protein methyltransferase CheR